MFGFRSGAKGLGCVSQQEVTERKAKRIVSTIDMKQPVTSKITTLHHAGPTATALDPSAAVMGAQLPRNENSSGRFPFLRRKKVHHWQPNRKGGHGGANNKSTTTTTSRTQQTSMMKSLLSDDLMIQICGFLTEQDCHAVMQTTRHFYELLGGPASSSGQHVWKCLLEQQWPHLKSCDDGDDALNAQRLQHEGLPDMRTLLRLKAKSAPTNVGSLVAHLNEIEHADEDDDDDEVPKAIQFTGTIGVGNRCFRSEKPFSCPSRLPTEPLQANIKKKSLWQRIRRRSSRNNSDRRWRPFVLPFQTPQGDYCLAPRLISYFEVSIREPTNNGGESARIWQTGRAECVAVGLSTYRFQLNRKMPGWDEFSYGYHGDDGSKFHCQGAGTKYGQRFGVNDTIGCGIDYQEKSIFYTLNGCFLGYAHKLEEEQVQRDWFPTVGVDSHAVCQVNFGKKPFAYDLQDMIQQTKQKNSVADN